MRNITGHITLLVGLIFATCLTTSAQDIHFSQYPNTPLLLNPATTGFYEGYERFIVNYKNQWAVIGSPYNTLSASFELPITPVGYTGRGGYIGTGLVVMKDQAGDSRFGLTQAALSFAGILPVGTYQKLSVGIQAGAGQRSASMDQLQWGNQYNGKYYDPTLPTMEVNTMNSFVYADVATGVYFEHFKKKETIVGYDVTRFTFGVALFHANAPRMQFLMAQDEKLHSKLIVHTSYRKDLTDTKVALVPSLMFQLQGPATELTLGGMIRYRVKDGTKYTGFYQEAAISFGAYHRLGDAVIPTVYFEHTDYGIGFSYDVNTSSFSEVSGTNGGFELSLKYHAIKRAGRKRR